MLKLSSTKVLIEDCASILHLGKLGFVIFEELKQLLRPIEAKVVVARRLRAGFKLRLEIENPFFGAELECLGVIHLLALRLSVLSS